jgi:hypothetical protein
MSDFETGGNEQKEGLEQMKRGFGEVAKGFAKMGESPFFVFARPYLDFTGKGKLYGVFYFVMAAASLVIPFAVIAKAIDSGVFDYGGAKFAFVFILSWLVIAFACWIGFQIWWNRRKNIAALAASEFIATPAFAELLQTFGEWLGTLTGIIGAGAGLIAVLFYGDEADFLFSAIGLNFPLFGAMAVITGPVTGFFIILISRFLAEQLRLWAALVNNTKEIAANIKK